MLNGMISSVSGAVNTSGSNVTVDSDAQFVSGSDNNIAIGANALNSTTTDAADYNIAIGTSALTAVTTGGSNIGIGHNTGAALLGKTGNIGIGTHSLVSATCNDAISIGYYAMSSAAAQTGTIAIGSTSLQSLTSGQKNIAIGYQALKEHTTGGGNIAIGDGAMNETAGATSSTSSDNMFVGVDSGGGDWADATSAYNIGIGNETLKGALNGANYNFAIGYQAMLVHTTGDRNIAIGYQTMVNTDAGANSLSSGDNIFIGHQSGGGTWGNTSASAQNVCVGNYTMDAALDGGDGNTCIGHGSLSALTTGSDNVGVGKNAGTTLTTGTDNTFVGMESGDATDDGSYNVAMGYRSLSANCGDENTAIGFQAGIVVTGDNNVCIGATAGDAITSGDGNVAVGRGSDCAATADNQIAIGNGAVTDGANKIRLGNASIATCNIQTDWTVDSDVRIKKEIVDNTLGLSFINNLKPRKYKKLHPADWDEAIKEDRYKDGFRDEFDDKKIWDGLIAQEVKEAVDKAGVTFSGWEIDSKGKQGVQYSSLVVPLIKAVQELSQQIEDLKKG